MSSFTNESVQAVQAVQAVQSVQSVQSVPSVQAVQSVQSVQAVQAKQPIIISIEGNIGSGKSSILHHLEKYYDYTDRGHNIIFLKEPVDEWSTICDASGETILSKFYKNPREYAFAFQIMAYATRLNVLRKTIAANPECKILICERSLEADKQIFANMLHDDGLIDSVSYQIYCRNFSEYAPDFNVAKVVYIDASPEKCFSRIAKRSRNGETNIELEYLQKCKKYHDEWLMVDGLAKNRNILHLNTDADVEYNLNDLNDLGISWIIQIIQFLNA